jgi:hypothetical protein
MDTGTLCHLTCVSMRKVKGMVSRPFNLLVGDYDDPTSAASTWTWLAGLKHDWERDSSSVMPRNAVLKTNGLGHCFRNRNHPSSDNHVQLLAALTHDLLATPLTSALACFS